MAERFLFVTDSHGDHIDTEAAETLFRFKRWFKPTKTIHGGDAIDFRWLRQGAGNGEKADDCKRDVDMGLRFLTDLEPDAYLVGNHEFRLWQARYSWEGMQRLHAASLIETIESTLEPFGTEIQEYDKETEGYKLGPLTFLHGYYHGNRSAYQHSLAWGDCIFGHIHQESLATNERGEQGRSAPCLCDTNPVYARAKPGTRRWEVGFLYGEVFDNGTYAVQTAKRNKAGEWNLPKGAA